MFDWIRGRKHPSTLWQSEPGFEINLDLDKHALCRCRIGDPIEWLSGLGPPEDTAALRERRYCYYSKGIEIEEEDGKVSYFAVYWIDYLEAGFQPFRGAVTYQGRTVPLGPQTSESEFTRVFGGPYWRDQDQYETILFYEFRDDLEWEVEFTRKGRLKAMSIVWPALMAEAEQREQYGVNLPWPPPRR